jgi:hypothetical protein
MVSSSFSSKHKLWFVVGAIILLIVAIGFLVPFKTTPKAQTSALNFDEVVEDSAQAQKFMKGLSDAVGEFDKQLAFESDSPQVIDIQGGIDENDPREFSISVILKGKPNYIFELAMTAAVDMQEYSSENLSSMAALDVRLEEIESEVKGSSNKLRMTFLKKENRYRIRMGVTKLGQFVQGGSLYIDFIPIKENRYMLQITDELVGKYISDLTVSTGYSLKAAN